MDLLGHVNNVTYLDYLAEAREALSAPPRCRPGPVAAPPRRLRRPAGLPPASRAGRHLGRGRRRSGTLTLAHEVCDERRGRAPRTAPSTCALDARPPTSRRARTTSRGPRARRPPLAPGPGARRPGRHHLAAGGAARRRRRGRAGPRRRARGVLPGGAHPLLDGPAHARAGVEPARGRAHRRRAARRRCGRRREPYDVRSWIGHVGTRSFTDRRPSCATTSGCSRAAVGRDGHLRQGHPAVRATWRPDQRLAARAGAPTPSRPAGAPRACSP